MTRAEIAKLLENQRNAARRAQPASPLIAPPASPVQFEPKTHRNGEALEIWFPLPPSWNRTYLARAIPSPKKRGRFIAQVYKSEEAKDYAKTIEAICIERGVRPWLFTIMLKMTAVVAMERAGCDLDDRLKVWLDACQGFVFENDEQVAELHVRRIVDPKRPGITVTFEPIPVDRYGQPTLNLTTSSSTHGEQHDDEA